MNTTYDYYFEVKNDIREALNNGDYDYITSQYIDDETGDFNGDIEGLQEELYDAMWIDDSITGNASGSYTFSTYEAENNICHNFDLIEEAAASFGIEPTVTSSYEHGAEFWDVTIRCYVLSECLNDVLTTEIDNIHDIVK
jgi:hypothetical protein